MFKKFFYIKQNLIKNITNIRYKMFILFYNSIDNYICPLSFNFAINVSTFGTIVPACLTGGSSTDKISILAVVSTPRSFAVIFLIGFFLAFIIFGNVAYRGSLSRRSALKTVGIFILTTSKPPSTSRVTVRSSLFFSIYYKKI